MKPQMSVQPVFPASQPLREIVKSYTEGSMYGDADLGALFFSMNPSPLPSYTPGLLESIRQAADDARTLINDDIARDGYSLWKYIVVTSAYSKIFSLGGDLGLFIDLIRKRDREGLFEYGKSCVDLTYHWSRSLDLPITGISLIEGTAQGGGLEMALASNLIVAERGATMGFPEVSFGLFAGMGAMHFMSQRITPGEAQQIFLSGKVYSAEEFHERGLIDVLVETGEGQQAVLDIIRDTDRRRHAREAIRRIRTQQTPVVYEHLIDTVSYWADAALTLSERELSLMERIVKTQRRKLANRVPAAADA
jgi:DSF synthase